jgi:hypothetical protein
MEKIENGYKNENVLVMFYPKTEYYRAYIIAKDLTDMYNEPTIYTKKIRGIEKAWKFIEQIFNNYELQNDLKLKDISKILDDKFNLNTRYYCAVD